MKNSLFSKTAVSVALCLSGFLLAPGAHAEDTEIFFASSKSGVPANVLFILDTSGSMNDKIGGKKKINILKDSLKNILAQQYPGLNVGLMHFNTYASGPDFPVTDLEALSSSVDSAIPAGRTVRETLGHIIDKQYYASGKTLIVPALYEAYAYFAGDSLRSGKRKPNSWNEGQKKYKGGNSYASHAAAYSPPWDPNANPRKDWRKCSQNDAAKRWGYGNICVSGDIWPGSCRTLLPNTTYREVCKAGYKYTGSGENRKRVCKKPLEKVYNTETLKYCYRTTKGGFHDPKYISPISPIAYPCQDNYIVLLSDGEPTRRDDGVNGLISKLLYGDKRWRQHCKNIKATTNNNINKFGRCGVDLLEALYDADKDPKLPLGKNVTTYTIGFDLSGNNAAKNYLKMLASAGGGKYADANSASELVNRFKDILTAISKKNTSFSAPTFSISQANKLSYSDDVYMSMFEASQTPRWEGNVKGYQIKHEGIFDVNSNLAVDASGQFVDTAQSYWSSSIDGGNVLSGGVASKATTLRKVYTFTGTGTPVSPVALTSASHALSRGNTNLTKALLGLPAAASRAERNRLIDWARGIDVNDEDNDGDNTDARYQIGDPLHSKPAILSYSGGKKVMYSITNQGYLHAFDVSGNATTYGNEIFSFIPRELLPNLKPLMDNQKGKPKVYGLDGHLVAWQNGNKSYLFFGMRRGGSNYYAMDVSNPDSPKLMWVIQGGVTPGFEKMGQSWSRPSLLRVATGGGNNTILVAFGGGYDTNQDNVTVRTPDTMGNYVYMVDALTGRLVWTAGPGGDLDIPFQYSIPSELRAIDLDGNGVTDRLYFGDMGGQLWRIDLDKNALGSSSRWYKLADFAGNTAADNRRFYYPPSVGVADNGTGRFLAVAIGSGYRAHPLNTVIKDHLYMLQDTDVNLGDTTMSSTGTLHLGSLYDATANDIGSGITTLSKALGGKHGWYINLSSNGEKVLSQPLIFDRQLHFNSYQPVAIGGGTVDVCKPVKSKGRAYVVNLLDATPTSDINTDGKVDVTDRFRPLAEDTIPSAPQPVFSTPLDKDGDGKPDSGTDCTNYTDFWTGKTKTAGACTPVNRTYWNEQQ